MKCEVDGCDRAASGRRLCSMHYQRWWRHGDTSSLRGRGLALKDRLLERIRVGEPDECWNWWHEIETTYPLIADGGGGRLVASRAAYQVFVGPIPDGEYVCHRCDNPKCCNPAHLFLGSHADNMRDMAQKKRAWRTHCPQGHEYTEANVYISPRGARHCRTCRRQWALEKNEKLKAERRGQQSTRQPVGRPRRH